LRKDSLKVAGAVLGLLCWGLVGVCVGWAQPLGLPQVPVPEDLEALSAAVEEVRAKGTDIAVLSNPETESLGRFAVTFELSDLVAFMKALTSPGVASK